jgi:hypothetical protein
VKFWEEDAEMTRCFNDFLSEGLLFFEVALELQKSLAAALDCVGITAAPFAFAAKHSDIKPALSQDHLDPFGLIGILRMIWWKVHWLSDSMAIAHVPTITHPGLLAARLRIHPAHEECIRCISGMSLGMIR